MACLAPCTPVVGGRVLFLCSRTEKDVPAKRIFVQVNKLFDRVLETYKVNTSSTQRAKERTMSNPCRTTTEPLTGNVVRESTYEADYYGLTVADAEEIEREHYDVPISGDVLAELNRNWL